MTSLVTQYSNDLALLPAPLEAHEAEDIGPQDFLQILFCSANVTKNIYHYSFAATFYPVTVAALDLADDILLVLRSTSPVSAAPSVL